MEQSPLLLFVLPTGVIFENCDRSYTVIAGKCYKFHQSKRSWENARDVCSSEGTTLASVLTQDEYDGLLSHMNAHCKSKLYTQYYNASIILGFVRTLYIYFVEHLL